MAKPSPITEEELIEKFHTALLRFVSLTGRFPMLKALAVELKRMGAGDDPPARNGSAMQVVVDSYDMLVIDLCSLCEGFDARGGLFAGLRGHLGLLRPFVEGTPKANITFVGERPQDEESCRREVERAGTEARNAIFDRLFPPAGDGTPRRVATRADLHELTLRFKANTQRISDDRNKVRAHRFEDKEPNPRQWILDFEQLDAHVEVVGQFLHDLYLVVTRGRGHAMDPLVPASPEGTAEDLADLIVWGSIDHATERYGLVKHGSFLEDQKNPPWYWKHRERFFENGGKTTTDGDDESQVGGAT